MKSGTIFEAASTPAPGIIDIGDRRQHFLDDLLVDEASRVSRYVNRPDKFAGNPIMVADRPWEQGKYGGRVEGVEIVGQTVLYDEEEGIFKMWYVPWAWEDRRRRPCASRRHGQRLLAGRHPLELQQQGGGALRTRRG